MNRYADRKAVIIGGTHGMGLATAQALLREGAQVIVTGRNPDNVTQARRALAEGATVLRSDIAAASDIEGLASAVRERCGGVDALFVFAAVAEFEAFEQVSPASFDRQFAINTRGAFFAVQALGPLLRSGASVTLATVTPATGSPQMAVYMATKAAVRAFAQVVAAEWLAKGVRVNTLAPGFIDTPTLGLASLTPEQRQAFEAIGNEVTPMKRHGTVEEIARAALFLAFDATFSTGIELVVDGGLSTVDNPPAQGVDEVPSAVLA